jgi:hypothetical protein
VFRLATTLLLCSYANAVLLHDHDPCRRGDDEDEDNAAAVSSAACTDSLDAAATTEATALERARQMVVPEVVDTTDGEAEHGDFWSTHAALLRAAWREWETEAAASSSSSSSSSSSCDGDGSKNGGKNNKTTVILPALHVKEILAPEQLQQPRREEEEEDPASSSTTCWRWIAPDVYVCDRFLSPMGTATLQRFVDAALRGSGIPRRRPNGMNRFGGIFHPAAVIHNDSDSDSDNDNDDGMDVVDGAVALQTFERFYAELLHDHVRPLGRHFFKRYIRSDADDGESYAFTIRYRADEDVRLNEHVDASLYTININLNSEDDMDDGTTKASSSYDGSSVYFVTEDDDDDDETDEKSRANTTTTRRTTVAFAPGSAVLHRGQIRHGTMPLTSGERTNLVIWVYGEHGYVRVRPYDDDDDGDDAGFLWRNNNEF